MPPSAIAIGPAVWGRLEAKPNDVVLPGSAGRVTVLIVTFARRVFVIVQVSSAPEPTLTSCGPWPDAEVSLLQAMLDT